MKQFIRAAALAALPVAAPLLFAASAPAAIVADAVADYTPGSIKPAYANSSAAALGGLEPDTGGGYVLDPFDAAYSPTQIAGFAGAGGQLTLHLSSPVTIAAGSALGVHSGVGLIDTSYPSGQNSSPAGAYTDPRTATLSVSADGSHFVTVAQDYTFSNPSNFYDQGITSPGSQQTPGSDAADQSEPFFGTLASFDGKDWPGTLAVLDGSAGGAWFDLSAVPLTQINYVRFATGSGETMYVDSVSAVPEPGMAGLLGLGLLLMRRRSRQAGQHARVN